MIGLGLMHITNHSLFWVEKTWNIRPAHGLTVASSAIAGDFRAMLSLDSHLTSLATTSNKCIQPSNEIFRLDQH